MTKLNWTPFVITFLLGSGMGVCGTLTYQHFKAQDTSQVSPDSESSTRSASGGVPAELKQIVPSFNASPTTNASLASSQNSAQRALSQGNAFYDGRNWNQAALQYEQAVAGGLDNADVRTDLGNAYRFLGQPQKALEQYRRAQKQNPQHEQSLFNQGGLYAFSLHDNAKAIAKWREYIQRFPQGATVAEARQLIVQAQSGQLSNQTDAPATASVTPKS